jgi:hypothetical protein
LDFAGPAAGEFRSRRRPRRLARFVFFVCLFDGALTFALAARKFHAPGTTLLLVGPLLCLSIAGVGLAVRNARIRVDSGGVHWGWKTLGFRMGRGRIKGIRFYGGALAIEAKRGSVWYLSQYDWDRFDRIPKAFADSGLEVDHQRGRVPIRARMQGYGVVLDGLMLVALLGSALLLLFGALR